MSSDYVPNQDRVTTKDREPNLSFDEVAKLFTVAIAEASTILGVSASDLTRICRENGVPRWPYRKILAGKTVEDIKREAAKEKALLEKMAQMPSHHGSNSISLNKSGSFSFGTAVPDRERMRSDFMKQQQGGQGRGYTLQTSSHRPLHIDHRAQLQNQFHLRINIPTYLDDFKHGFPRKGLSTLSTQWWGNSVPDERDKGVVKAEENVSTAGQLNGGTDELASGQQNEKSSNASFRETNRDANDLMPASILTRTRKSAVTNGRKALGIAVTRGYGTYRLREKEEALLRNVFEDSLPSLWRASLLT